eukprot:IDg7457t1
MILSKERAVFRPAARSMNAGPTPSNPQLESTVADWVCSQRYEEHAVSTSDIVCKVLSLDPDFRDSDSQKLSHCVYDFMRRNHLSVRVRTNVAQLTKGHMRSLKKDFARCVMTSFKNRVHDPSVFLNMDEKAVYF